MYHLSFRARSRKSRVDRLSEYSVAQRGAAELRRFTSHGRNYYQHGGCLVLGSGFWHEVALGSWELERNHPKTFLPCGFRPPLPPHPPWDSPDTQCLYRNHRGELQPPALPSFQVSKFPSACRVMPPVASARSVGTPPSARLIEISPRKLPTVMLATGAERVSITSAVGRLAGALGAVIIGEGAGEKEESEEEQQGEEGVREEHCWKEVGGVGETWVVMEVEMEELKPVGERDK
ncbi:hypothetical protein BZA05DRAFT_416192 [Tricharina praecox]|uniref:uncharacterized protein n=1 Tax=Tricharina praecox TaxID=43433 RepID=UPI00222007ED|nr:uncharacterized protein BZA05DRAFT_416192 [Tricharina praecox]KAI5856527.1 hypothetical protein BZA05DRAFT_416192 [Tricharina praecox]